MVSATRELLEVEVDGSQVIVGVFASDQEAERARELLAADGFDMDNVRLLKKSIAEVEAIVPNISPGANQRLTEPEAQRMQGQTAVGQGSGSASRFNSGWWIGLITGALGGAAMGLALMEIPFIRPVLMNNIIAMVACGLLGAALGSFAGSFAGLGVPEEDLTYFTEELGSGAYLVAIRTNRIDEALDVLRDAGARNLAEYESH